jgi:hypothetical protein
VTLGPGVYLGRTAIASTTANASTARWGAIDVWRL